MRADNIQFVKVLFEKKTIGAQARDFTNKGFVTRHWVERSTCTKSNAERFFSNKTENKTQ